MTDAKYLAWVRTLPCCSCGREPPSHAHHATFGRGLGQKASDRDTMPLCGRCHDEFHSASGRFANVNHENRRCLQEDWIRRTQTHRAQLDDPELL